MFVNIVYISVKLENIADFKEACLHNHENSIQEAGNLRFDVLQSANEPAKFVLYEAFKTQQDAAAHKETAHYQTWRKTVANWMAEPRQGITYCGLHPVESD